MYATWGNFGRRRSGRMAGLRAAGAGAELSRPGGDVLRMRGAGEPSTPLARAGSACRWCCWPRRPPSSPAGHDLGRLHHRAHACSSASSRACRCSTPPRPEEGRLHAAVNLMLLTGVVVLVLNFRNSGQPRRRYGIAVTGTFVCTLAAGDRGVRRIRLGLAVVLGGSAAAAARHRVLTAMWLKIPQGGYVPQVSARHVRDDDHLARGGRALFARFARTAAAQSSSRGCRSRASTVVPGTAVFHDRQADYLPGPLLHNLSTTSAARARAVVT